MKKNNLFIPLIAAALLTTGCVSKNSMPSCKATTRP